MATTISIRPANLPATRRVATAATGESAAVRWILIGLAVGFLALFIFLPLAIVFSQAFAKGIGVYVASLRTPDALAAIRLTLLRCGHRGATECGLWSRCRLGDRQVRVRRQESVDHSDRSAVLGFAGGFGPDLRAALRIAGSAGTVAGPRTTCRSSSRCRASCWRRSS